MSLSPVNSGVLPEDFGIKEGDQFGFISNNALFREYSNGGIVNDHNGFIIYGVFIEEFDPFSFEIDDISDTNHVTLELVVDESSHSVNDIKQFFVHDTDWEDYLDELKDRKSVFDQQVSNNELSGNFTIIDAETEIGYEMESHKFVPLEGNDYFNETQIERIRFQRSTGVIWEHYNNTREETFTNNAQIRDIYFYSFQRDIEFVSETSSKVIIPGFRLAVVLPLLFTIGVFSFRNRKYWISKIYK